MLRWDVFGKNLIDGVVSPILTTIYNELLGVHTTRLLGRCPFRYAHVVNLLEDNKSDGARKNMVACELRMQVLVLHF